MALVASLSSRGGAFLIQRSNHPNCWYRASTYPVFDPKLGMGLDAVYKRLSRVHQGLKTCIELRLQKLEAKES